MAANGRTEIVILGAGFGGFFTARSLERTLHGVNARVTLVSDHNYQLMTPLLFEVGSGVLNARVAVNPIRDLLKKTRFIEARVEHVDLAQRRVFARQPSSGESVELPYDQLVLALGGKTDRSHIPGSENATGFKSLGEALCIRSRIVERFEAAAVATDPNERRALLTFVVIGGGLVGVEFTGEISNHILKLCDWYSIRPGEIEFHLIEAGPHLLPEMEPKLVEYIQRVFDGRGIQMHIHVPVDGIEPGRVRLGNGRVIESRTILLAAGVATNPVVAELPVPKDRKKRVATEPTMRVQGLSNVWALGDCASIPDREGKPYPQLAQHALREAKVLASNIAAVLRGRAPKRFQYRTMGTLALLGGSKGVGIVLGRRIRGLFAWFVWRSYYLYRVPRFEGRVRVLVDWAVAALFGTDAIGVEVPPVRPVREAKPKRQLPSRGLPSLQMEPPVPLQ